MDRRLEQMVQEIRKAYGIRPGLGDLPANVLEVTPELALHEMLLAEGLQFEFSEQDVFDAHIALGLGHDDAVDAMQRLASWW